MSGGIFITATGTDVGKTYVTALITKKLRDYGINAGYYKAALSGALHKDNKLIAGDSDYVCKISGIPNNPNSLVSYIYETAVSPHLAAKIENNTIDINVLKSHFESVKQEFDLITVEGSGGIVCPLRIDDEILMLTDIIKLFNLDIILVASAKLGTINSVVLTAHYAKCNNINIQGIILNEYEKDNYLHEDNKNQIEHLTGIPVIACVPYGATELDINSEDLKNLYKELAV